MSELRYKVTQYILDRELEIPNEGIDVDPIIALCMDDDERLENLVRWAIRLGFATGHADTEQDLLSEVEWQIKELREQYCELLYGVASKFPDETRHETALRYILEAENHCSGPEQGNVDKNGESKQ